MTRIVILVLALVAAGAAALLVRSMMSNSSEPQAAIAPNTQQEDVLVAAADIALGEAVKGAAVTWQPWPKTALAPSYIVRTTRPNALTELEGSVARAPIAAGEPIIENKLVRGGDSGFMAAILKPGTRAVSVSISPETGAGGFILPNDYVDVIVTREQEVNDGYSTTQAVTSETLLSKIRVLAIDQSFKEGDGEQVVVGKTATIELTPPQAEALARAQLKGQISLALRALADNVEDKDAVEEAEQDTVEEEPLTSSITVYRYGAPSLVTKRGVQK